MQAKPATPTRQACPERSKGHLAFAQSHWDDTLWEFFVREDDQIYRAKVEYASGKPAEPVMTDGYRCGRWEGPATAEYCHHLETVWEVPFHA